MLYWKRILSEAGIDWTDVGRLASDRSGWRNEDLRCRYEGCERLCRSRAGFVRHESMLHRRVEGRVRFACEDCRLEVATKGALVGHRRTYGARRRLEDGRRECRGCGARVSYANFARHVRSCRAGGGKQWRRGEGGC